MKATHTDYLHPHHLRVEDAGDVYCMAPSCSDYARLNKSSLPSFFALNHAQAEALPRHSTTWRAGDQS